MDKRDNASAYWLWVDPRRELSYNARTFDQGSFLDRAADLFQTKERWGGQRPGVVKAHRDQAEYGLKPAAAALGLQVMVDPMITPGTYRLGLATETKETEDD